MARGLVARRTQVILRLLAQRTRRPGLLVLSAVGLAGVLLWGAERDAPGTHLRSVSDVAWFLVVTMATVGYGDAYPVTPTGRMVTGAFILLTLFSIGFLLTAMNDVVMEVKRMEDSGLIGTDMDAHVVVVGFSPVARSAIAELLDAGRSVALLCGSVEEVPVARRLADRGPLFVSVGDASQETLRDTLNADRAVSAVIATGDDSQNIVASLNFRAINSAARIVVAVQAEALRKTLVASGATYVASPHELSGRLVASAAFEPEVARFIEDVTSGAIGGSDLQQYSAAPFAGASVRALREKFLELGGPLLVAVGRRKGDGFDVISNPDGALTLEAEDHIVVLGDVPQNKRIREKYEIEQGR
ncbi:MAG: NAD-binding protein [Polyangiales bacterium]